MREKASTNIVLSCSFVEFLLFFLKFPFPVKYTITRNYCFSNTFSYVNEYSTALTTRVFSFRYFKDIYRARCRFLGVNEPPDKVLGSSLNIRVVCLSLIYYLLKKNIEKKPERKFLN